MRRHKDKKATIKRLTLLKIQSDQVSGAMPRNKRTKETNLLVRMQNRKQKQSTFSNKTKTLNDLHAMALTCKQCQEKKKQLC